MASLIHMGFLFLALLAAAGFAIGSVTRSVQKGKNVMVNVNDPSVKQWENYVRPAAQQNRIDPGVAMFWLAVESGGNICAVGNRHARGPDGSPKEIGLFQLYNPDDFEALRAKASDLRAYCVKPGPGEPDPQKLSRPPTQVEIAQHIALGLQLIHKCMSTADRYLMLSHTAWSPSTADYWRAVKLVHALPVIVSQGFLQVNHKLGRAPITWAEFRSTYEQIQPRAKFNPHVQEQDGYWRALENAQLTGDYFEGTAVA